MRVLSSTTELILVRPFSSFLGAYIEPPSISLKHQDLLEYALILQFEKELMSGRGDISLVRPHCGKEKRESDSCTANILSFSIEKELAPFPMLANSCNQ